VWQVKLCDPSLTCVIPVRFRDEFLVIKHYTNLRLLTYLQTQQTLALLGPLKLLVVRIRDYGDNFFSALTLFSGQQRRPTPAF